MGLTGVRYLYIVKQIPFWHALHSVCLLLKFMNDLCFSDLHQKVKIQRVAPSAKSRRN